MRSPRQLALIGAAFLALASSFTACNLVPLGGPVPVVAGTQGTTVTVNLEGLGDSVDVSSSSTEVIVHAAAQTGPYSIRVTVSVDPGAQLGVHPLDLVLHTGGAADVSAICECIEVTWPYTAPSASQPPTIVYFMTDDQRYDSVPEMPLLGHYTRKATISNDVVHEPMCCPSRATTLTGQYGFHNHVTSNETGSLLDESRTVATMLHDAGYQTGLYGKYVNGYPFGRGYYTPPGWDDWNVWRGVIGSYDIPYAFNILQGAAFVPYSNQHHPTEVLASRAREFIRRSDPNRPLFLYIAPTTPHGPVYPANGDLGTCADTSFPLPPNFNSRNPLTDPPWMSTAVDVKASTAVKTRRETCDANATSDRVLFSIASELEKAGRFSNSDFLFTSDNGFGFGEHRLWGKGHLFEESIRVPLVAFGKDVVPGTYDRVTQNVDYAPTMLDWAGVPAPPGFFDGSSFADDLRGTNTIPNPQERLLLACRTGGGTQHDCGGAGTYFGYAWGLRTTTHKYVEYPDGSKHLFDLTVDPYEMVNLASTQPTVVTQLHDRLMQLAPPHAFISGIVRDEATGLPVAGAMVRLYLPTGGWPPSYLTLADGFFSLSMVPSPCDCLVRIDDPQGRYRREYHDGTYEPALATPLHLADDQRLVVNPMVGPISTATGQAPADDDLPLATVPAPDILEPPDDFEPPDLFEPGGRAVVEPG